MKYLVIITRETSEFDRFWGLGNNTHEQVYASAEFNILLLKKSRLVKLLNYAVEIQRKLSLLANNINQIGVIFHKLNGDMEAIALLEGLKSFFNDKIAFCTWYSSTNTDFWNDNDHEDDKPYNSLKEAWLSGDEDKKGAAFNKVWDFFATDSDKNSKTYKLSNALIALSENLNKLVYDKNGILVKSADCMQVIKERDKLINQFIEI